MFSKILFFVVFFTACARTDVSTNAPLEVQLRGAGGDCLGHLSETLNTYADRKLSVTQIDSFWGCISQALTDYENITAGAGPQPDHYSPQAVRRFIEKYFLRNRRLSDALLTEVMELKRVLVAGSARELSRSDLDNMLVLVNKLKMYSIALQPHIKILLKRQPLVTEVELESAGAALEEVLRDLGVWLEQQNQGYDFDQLSGFLHAIEDWNKPVGTSAWSKVAGVFPTTKSVFIGGARTGIAATEWQKLCYALARGYRVYLAFTYNLEVNVDRALTSPTVAKSLLNLTAVFTQSVGSHKGGEISMAEWREFFAAVERSQFFPPAMNAVALTGFWQWLLKRPLGDGEQEPTGMNGVHVARLHDKLRDWQTLLASPASNVRFSEVLNDSPPMLWDGEGRLEFHRPLPLDWTPEARAHMAWAFVLTTWLKEAYGGSSDSLTPEQMDTLAYEVLPMLQRFGWLQSTKPTFGRRRLREADLFTAAGNGDGRIQVTEATRLLALVVSSYRTATLWLGEAERTCGSHDADCVRSLPLRSASSAFAALPELKMAMGTWSPRRFLQYLDHAEQASLSESIKGVYKTADLLEMIQLLQYVEAFVQRFDNDISNTIERGEADSVFNVFGATLTTMLTPVGVPGDQVFAFFMFMMKYGETPFSMYGGQVAYLNWKLHSDSWSFNANREILINILFHLAQM